LFYRANLSNQYLHGSYFNIAQLQCIEPTDFTEAILERTLLSKIYQEYINGSKIYQEYINGSTNLQRVIFTKANLRNAGLSGANLTDAIFIGADLKGANLIGANLTNADFTDADLTDADLSFANLNNVNFRNAILTNVKFHHSFIDADLKDATFAVAKKMDDEQDLWNNHSFLDISLWKPFGVSEHSFVSPYQNAYDHDKKNKIPN